MQIEKEPKQLLDLIERHRTFAVEGRTLKTPVQIGPYTCYASLDRKEISFHYCIEFNLELDIEVPIKLGLDIHAYLYKMMQDINARPMGFHRIPIEEMPTAIMYGRQFVIQTLYHTDFSKDKTRLKLACAYAPHVEPEDIEPSMRKTSEWPELHYLSFPLKR